LIDAQKKLLDIAGRQMNASMQATGRAPGLLKPLQAIPVGEFTREGVQTFVEAEKKILDSLRSAPVSRPREEPQPAAKKASSKRAPRRTKARPAARPAHAGA
jgi:hypothetical protein